MIKHEGSFPIDICQEYPRHSSWCSPSKLTFSIGKDRTHGENEKRKLPWDFPFLPAAPAEDVCSQSWDGHTASPVRGTHNAGPNHVLMTLVSLSMPDKPASP